MKTKTAGDTRTRNEKRRDRYEAMRRERDPAHRNAAIEAMLAEGSTKIRAADEENKKRAKAGAEPGDFCSPAAPDRPSGFAADTKGKHAEARRAVRVVRRAKSEPHAPFGSGACGNIACRRCFPKENVYREHA